MKLYICQFRLVPPLSVLTLLALLLGGCGGSGTGDETNDSGTATALILPFASAQEMEDYLKLGFGQQTNIGNIANDVAQEPVAASEAFSTTNVQELGVDEVDRIKSDGNYLYVVEGGTPNYWITPLEPASVAPLPEESRDNAIRILALASDPPGAEEVAQIPLPPESYPKGSFLLTGRAEDRPDLLVAVLNYHGYSLPYWFDFWAWQSGKTGVQFNDVSDPTRPEAVAGLTFDGHLVGSRRIGESLYLVLRHSPAIPNYHIGISGAAEMAENEQRLAETKLTDLLPNWWLDDADQGDLLSHDQCYRTEVSDEAVSADLVVVLAIDLRQPEQKPHARCLVGPSETLYISTEALYLATSRHYYQPVAEVSNTLIVYPPDYRTDLHKFALNSDGFQYRGSASVDGHLGWEQDKKSFRMGEYLGVLRVATSVGNDLDGSASSRLYTLREGVSSGGTPALEIIGQLPNNERPQAIGKPGERLYASRFLGERGYLVTFRVTDPLYVLDLSDPTDPFLAGELQIAGYSDYLHPIGSDTLLGIGKDAIADPGGDEGRGAWYQGVKLSLFDVSNPAVPRELGSLVIGKRGSHSDLLYDHHAMAWLAASGAIQPNRLALPIRLHETLPAYSSGSDPGDPWFNYDWTHTGLYLFDIYDGPSGSISPVGKMVVESTGMDSRYWNSRGDDRVLLRGDEVHYIHGDSVWSAPWNAADSQITGPQ